MDKRLIDWLFFVLLSLIWGSSFMLMKWGLVTLSPYQVAALRISSSGLILLPITIKAIRSIPSWKQLWIVFLSGSLGSLIPAFLFCIAEQKIDSALAGSLNSITPIFVIVTGALFFKAPFATKKLLGIVIAMVGSFLLMMSKTQLAGDLHLFYILLVVLATALYGVNVNLVAKNLLHIPSLHIASIALSLNAIPALGVLFYTGYFNLPLLQKDALLSTGAGVLLGIVGTAIATILFYMLVKRAGGVFASMVTYGIPFVAIGWGMASGEAFGWAQVGCLLIILIGVYFTNRKTAS